MVTDFKQLIDAVQEPENTGLMSKLMARYEAQMGSLFDGGLKVMFLAPADVMLENGDIDRAEIATRLAGMAASHGNGSPQDESVQLVANHLEDMLLNPDIGGRMHRANSLLGAEDLGKFKVGVVVPGNGTFTSEQLIRRYSCDPDMNGVVLQPPFNDPQLHLSRVAYHELGHVVSDYLQGVTTDELDMPGWMDLTPLPKADGDDYWNYHEECIADAYMAMMMVREYGQKGADYAQGVAHIRALGFLDSGVAKYYTSSAIEAALARAQEIGFKKLARQTPEEIGRDVYQTLHHTPDAMLKPDAFLKARADQQAFDAFLLTRTTGDLGNPELHWLLTERDRHDDGIGQMVFLPDAAPGTPEREALRAAYQAELELALERVWDDPFLEDLMLGEAIDALRADRQKQRAKGPEIAHPGRLSSAEQLEVLTDIQARLHKTVPELLDEPELQDELAPEPEFAR